MQSGLTLFAFDCSGSVNNISLYFTTLQSIVDKYYVKDRGDIFVKWDDIFRYETYEELQTWIKSQKGYGLTSAELIAQVLKEQGPKIKHLIITTDGYIDSSNVTKSDDLMNALGWKPEYVTVYIIGTSAKDVSVVTPYVRESPHIIYDVNINETKIIEEVLPNYIKSFTEMHNIKSKTIFMNQYPFILNYMFSKCRGKEADPEVVDKINKLEQNLKQDPTDIVGYETKIECLKALASGLTKNNYDKTSDDSVNTREQFIFDIKNKFNHVDCTLKGGVGDKIEAKQLSDDNFILNIKQGLKQNVGSETNLKSELQDCTLKGGVGDKIEAKQLSDNNFILNIKQGLKKNLWTETNFKPVIQDCTLKDEAGYKNNFIKNIIAHLKTVK